MTASTMLRAVAVAIAIAGAIDPSIAWSNRDKPVVSLIAASTRDQALVDRASRSLERDVVVARGADAGAAALVVVGDRVPAGIEPGETPAFALLPAEAVSIDRIDVPERASLDSRVPVGFIAHVPAGSSTAEARLRVNGLVVDRQALTLKAGDDALTGTLTFAATATGLARLQVEVASGAMAASADAAIDVDRTRWSVLSFDPRPSWASTFVRRALEEDPRFVVTARVATAPQRVDRNRRGARRAWRVAAIVRSRPGRRARRAHGAGRRSPRDVRAPGRRRVPRDGSPGERAVRAIDGIERLDWPPERATRRRSTPDRAGSASSR